MSGTKRKLTEADYEDLSRSYVEHPVTPDEVVGESVVGTTALRKGRPTGERRRGETPVRSLRLPPGLEARLLSLAEAEGVGGSEVIRRAIMEYVERHSAGPESGQRK
jgi:hypothetical protein